MPTNEWPSAFLIRLHCEIAVQAYLHPVLSLPALEQGAEITIKDLLTPEHLHESGKYTLAEHFAHLRGDRDFAADRPLLVVGMRNSLVNLRAPVIRQGRIHALAGESPAASVRPYFGLACVDGRLRLERTLAGGNGPAYRSDFFCAAPPVLWDDFDAETLFSHMLTEFADHSHLFALPRGRHPLASDSTRALWSRLQATFLAQVHADQASASAALQALLATCDPPLPRAEDYFHAVLGEQADGRLIFLFAHGRPEDLGRHLQRRGCRRAVCIDNSGSIMPTFLPHGIEGEAIPLLRAPNFRPRGRALLVLPLANATYSTFPSLDERSSHQNAAGG